MWYLTLWDWFIFLSIMVSSWALLVHFLCYCFYIYGCLCSTANEMAESFFWKNKLVLCSNLINNNIFIGKSGFKNKGWAERKHFHHMLHSPTNHNYLSRANLMLGSRNFLQVPWRCRVSRQWANLGCLPGPKQLQEWKCRSQDMNQHPYRIPAHPRWEFYTLGYSARPSNIIL